MQAQEQLNALIDKAAHVVGSEAKLAKAMGIPQSHISNWKAGDRTCTPEDRARLAGFAQEDALQELVRAVLEKTAGTLRGDQLRKVLGKSLPQIIVGAVIALLLGTSLNFGNVDAGALVAFFAILIYSTMYIMLNKNLSCIYVGRWMQ
ncbi:hypothetical protein D9M73_86820 [compost metagenome]